MKVWNWKNLFLGVFVVAILFTFVVTVEAEEFTITGYGSKEFAVVDETERQAKSMVESWGTKKPVKIIIQGFADKTGKKAENHIVARDRAYEMKAFLEKYSDAKITPISRGDSENARKVIIDVKFAVEPVVETPVPESKSSGKLINRHLTIMGSLLLLICIVLLLLYIAGKKKPRASAKTVAADESKVEEVKNIEAEGRDGLTWLVPVRRIGGIWHTPFKTLEDQTKDLFRKDFQDAKKAVRQCMKDSRYETQVEILKKSGIIIIVIASSKNIRQTG